MASYTAQILVGEADPNHGGIDGITAQFLLSENDRPCWALFMNRSLRQKPTSSWIPASVETILEDGLLMWGYFLAKDNVIVSSLNELTELQVLDRCNLTSLPSERLGKLREVCRKICQVNNRRVVLAISALRGSSIFRQVGVLDNYAVDCEVALPVFGRNYSNWKNSIVTWGALSTDSPPPLPA